MVKPEGLVDVGGNQMPATIVRALGETRATELAQEANLIRRAMLAAIFANAEVTQRELALKANTSRATVRRTLDEFRKLKWMREYTGKLVLTNEGKKALETTT